jgi:hypothetical protein
MAAIEPEGGASAPSSVCAEPGCAELRWQARVRGIRLAVVSSYCREHSYQPLFEVLPVEPIERGSRINPDRAFHNEGARRREES